MSLRDMFSTTKQKRSRTPTSDPNDSNRSFVKNVKSRVSGLVPARISQWFSSSTLNSTGNGSTPTADGTDSSEDEPELIPPVKRKRYNSQESQYNQCFQVESTPFHADGSDTPNNHNVLYTSIQSSRGRNSFIREPNYASTRYVSNTDESNMEAASLDITERDTTYKSPHTASSSGHSVATKRKSIFESVGNPKDDMKKTKPAAPVTSPPSDVKPRFRSSLYGSPFYPGHTMYGGASASTYINYPIIKQRKAVKVKEAQKTECSDMSSSARTILDLLENCSSPLVEAKRIPVIQKRNYSLETTNSSPSTSKSNTYKMQELNVPSIASIMRLKQHSRLMDTTKAARQIIASHSSTLQSFQPFPANTTKSDSSWSNEKEETRKLKTRLTRANRGEDHLALPEPVQLPTAVLHIDKDNLPKFSITSPAGITTALNSTSTQSVLTSTYKPQATSEANAVSSMFTNTAVSTTPPRAWNDSPMFKFASPAASPVAMTNDLQLINEIDERNMNEPKASQESQHPNTFFTKQGESSVIMSTERSMGWKCSECWVNNRAHVEKCGHCGGKRSPAVDKAQDQRASAPVPAASSKPDAKEVEDNDWKCDNCWIKNKSSMNKCAACGDSKPDKKEPAVVPARASTPSSPVNNSEEDWKCENCWIKNKSSVKKCAACGGSKPDEKEPTASVSAPLVKQQEEDWKCENCWIKNKSSVKKCAACGGSKPGEKEVVVPAMKPESHSPFSKVPDEKFQEILRAQKNKWECSGCLTRNEPEKTKCQCCEMEREGPSKEITPKPFTFPKESNINFKFGIDPKEQEKNITKNTEQGPKPGMSILEQTETNNNNTYTIKFPPLVKSDDCKPKDDNKFDNKEDSVVPEQPKVSFMFGIPKTPPEKTPPAVAPSIDKPTPAQETFSFDSGFLASPKSDQTAPIKMFSSFLASSTPIASTKSQQSMQAPIATSLTNKNALNNEMKDTNTGFRFADVNTEKTKPFSFGAESRAPAATSFGASSSGASTSFSFGATQQSAPTASTAGPSNSLFVNPQPAANAVKPPAGNLFGGTELSAVPAAAPHFGLRNDSPSTAPTPTFSFGSTNNKDNKASPFGFKAGGTSNAFSMGTAAPLSSSTLGGSAGGMTSSMSGLNDPRSVASTSGFRTGAQENAWGANEEATFVAGAAPFTFGAMGNQFSANVAGPSSNAPTLFGAPSAASTQMFNMSGGATGAAGGGGLFGNAPQPVQPANVFGAQPAPGLFGATSQPSGFGAPAPAQQPTFGAPAPTQPPAFGAPTLTQPPAFGASVPTQQPTFGVPQQTQALAFGAPAQNQPLTFNASAPSQPPVFGAPVQNQQPVFGAPTSGQPPAFGAPAQPAAASGPAFNFGAGVFNFGQHAPQQSQTSGVYSFGGGNAMGGMGGEMSMGGGMMAQPMDGGLGGGGQFNMGSSPAPAPAAVRRVRKAVRRTQQR